MGDDNFLLVLGAVLVFPFVLYFLKAWLFATGSPGSTFHRVQRIAELDAHLSFDERLAERLRELEQEKAAGCDLPSAAPPTAPSPPSQGFGRRGV